MLSEAQRSELERALDRRERELLESIAGLRAALADPPGSRGPEVRDSGEDGRLRMDESQELSELDRHERQLAEVSAARLRMREGTYGVCEACEEPISFARLQALPTARLCIRDEERREQAAAHGR